MNDKQKVKTIRTIIREWYEFGEGRTQLLEGIVFAIDAVTDMEEDTCDGDSCTL